MLRERNFSLCLFTSLSNENYYPLPWMKLRLGFWNDCVWDRERKEWLFKMSQSKKVFCQLSKCLNLKRNDIRKISVINRYIYTIVDSVLMESSHYFRLDCFIPIVQIFTFRDFQILIVTKKSFVILMATGLKIKEKKILKEINGLIEKASLSKNYLVFLDSKRNAWKWQWNTDEGNSEKENLICTDCDHIIALDDKIIIVISNTICLENGEVFEKLDEKIIYIEPLSDCNISSLFFVSTKSNSYLMTLGNGRLFQWNNSDFFNNKPMRKCQWSGNILAISDSEDIWLISIDTCRKIGETPVLIRQNNWKFDDWAFYHSAGPVYKLLLLFTNDGKIEIYTISTDESAMPDKVVFLKNETVLTVDVSFMESFFQEEKGEIEGEKIVLNVESEKFSNFVDVSRYVNDNVITSAGRILLENFKELMNNNDIEMI